MRTFFGFVLVTLLFSGVGKLSAKDRGPFPGAEEKWQRYESPHFELYSRNGDFSSRDLLRNLELLRAVFLDTFRLEERRPCPVTIYFFSDDSEMSPYKPEAVSKNRQLAGYYLARPDRAVIMTSEEYGTAGSRQIIFHEYIHHLYQVAEQEPPVWYNEGTAELFSTIEVSDKKLVFGRPAPGHIMELQQERLLPLETLFAVDHSSPIYNTGKHTGVFYGESWALLHYWSFGQTDLKPEKVDAFRHWALFQGAKASAAETRAVFKDLLGMDYPEMQERLERYVRSGRYQGRQMPPPQIPPPESYARRPVSRDEIRERLAELALRVNRSPQGKLAMLHAVDNGTDRVRALEVLGMNAMVEEDEIGTRERWEQALAAGSKNPAIYHELGTIETRRWFRSFDYYFRLPPARADYLRSLLQRSIEYAPKQSSAYEMLAWVEAAAPEPSVANVNLVQEHFNSLKDKPRTLLALVMVRIRINDLATARSLLDSLEKMPLDEKNAATMTHAIKFVRARLDSRPLDESIETPATETAGKPGLKIHVPVAPPRVEEPK